MQSGAEDKKYHFVKTILTCFLLSATALPMPLYAAAGEIYGWGNNAYGKATPPDGNDFVAISAGGVTGNYCLRPGHSLALKSDGSIIGWGSNKFGQATPPDGNDFIAIAAGSTHSLALKSNGSIVGWGYNYNNLYGSWVGQETWIGQATPPDGNDFIAIAAGESHSIALKSDGSIVCWGNNESGQATPPDGNNFIAIAAGANHSIALKSDGSIVAWGDNMCGQATPPAGNNYTAIAAGSNHSLALKSDGSIVIWGCYLYGQQTPIDGNDFIAIAAGGDRSLALKSDGSIVIGGNKSFYNGEKPPVGNNYIAIAAGYDHYLAIKGNSKIKYTLTTSVIGGHGTIFPLSNRFYSDKIVTLYAKPDLGYRVKAWTGTDNTSFIGNKINTVTMISDKIVTVEFEQIPRGKIYGWGDMIYSPKSLPTGSDFIAISSSCALKSDGSIVALWSNNSQTPIPTGNDYVDIADQGNRCSALKSDGSIVVWGWNPYSPPAGNDYVAVAVGVGHNLALKSDGSIVGWGDNSNGEASPPAGNDFVAIAAGYLCSFALKSDGSIIAWGYDNPIPPDGNDYISIATCWGPGLALKTDGSIVGRGSGPMDNGYRAIAIGDEIGLALKSDGSITWWWNNIYGGHTVGIHPTGKNYTAIAAGGDYGIVIKPYNPSVIKPKSCVVKSGKGIGPDSFNFTATMTATPAQIDVPGDGQALDYWDIEILSDSKSIYKERIKKYLFVVKNGVYTYKRGEYIFGSRALISTIYYNSNKGILKISVPQIDLTGLSSPIYLHVTTGYFENYVGIAEIKEDVINGRQFIPIQLMSGYADDLQIQTIKVKAGKKPSTDSLQVKGNITFKNQPGSMSDLVITLGSQTFTIPAGSFTAKGSKFSCKNAPVVGGLGLANATFDFDKCTFVINVRNATIDSKSGTASLTLALGTFSEGVQVNIGR